MCEFDFWGRGGGVIFVAPLHLPSTFSPLFLRFLSSFSSPVPLSLRWRNHCSPAKSAVSIASGRQQVGPWAGAISLPAWNSPVYRLRRRPPLTSTLCSRCAHRLPDSSRSGKSLRHGLRPVTSGAEWVFDRGGAPSGAEYCKPPAGGCRVTSPRIHKYLVADLALFRASRMACPGCDSLIPPPPRHDQSGVICPCRWVDAAVEHHDAELEARYRFSPSRGHPALVPGLARSSRPISSQPRRVPDDGVRPAISRSGFSR